MVPADVAPATRRSAVFVDFNDESEDYDRRTDIRAHDRHHSWREVYDLLEVEA